MVAEAQISKIPKIISIMFSGPMSTYNFSAADSDFEHTPLLAFLLKMHLLDFR